MTIWQKLEKPIFILAPMEDVTDTVFRQILLQTGRPGLFFTEFTNVDGLFSKGADAVVKRLLFVPKEKPLIAQIWGMQPGNFYKAAQMLGEMGFDGIDLNMGCPQHDVTSHGACSALMKNHSLATEIIKATQEGARSTSSGQADLPVSVKTRIGFSTIQTEEWIGFLLTHNLAALTVHGRTVKEMSKVPAHWDEIGKAVKLRDQLLGKLPVIPGSDQAIVPFIGESIKIEPGSRTKSGMTKKEIASSSSYYHKGTTFAEGSPRNDTVHTLIIGNGDVLSLEEAKEKAEKYGIDGIMIGRGVFHNPWLFNASVDPATKTLRERIQLLLNHVGLYASTWGTTKHYPPLKKYFKIYLSGFDGASETRNQFMETNTPQEGIALAKKLLSELS